MESVVPDPECGHSRPTEEEACIPADCDLNVTPIQRVENDVKLPKSLESAALALKTDLKSNSYSWRSSGFTECTASCLGGSYNKSNSNLLI